MIRSTMQDYPLTIRADLRTLRSRRTPGGWPGRWPGSGSGPTIRWDRSAPGAQVAQIVNHAADRIIIVDDTLVPLLAKIAGELPGVEAFIVNGTGDVSASKAGCPCCATTNCWRRKSPITTGPSWTNGTRP